MAVDTNGNVYVADYDNYTIREITPSGTNWVVTTLAGSAGQYGSTDGIGSAARFYNSFGVAVDSAGNVYVGDTFNNRITKGTPPPALTLQMYAGLTILAPVGSTNQIQYVNDLNNTNWTTLTNLVLPSNPYIFIDYDSPGQSRRFYRDVLAP